MGRRSLEATARGEGPEDRTRKGMRWLFFAAEECQGRKIKAWTEALKKAIAEGRSTVNIQIEEGRSSAILVWPEPGVCWYSAYRIGTKAKEHDDTFKIMQSYPKCVDNVADTAGPNAGTPEPEAAAAPAAPRKGTRWLFLFDMGRLRHGRRPGTIKAWKTALRKAIYVRKRRGPRVDIQIEEGESSAILVWPERVCWQSAYRIGKKGERTRPHFQINAEISQVRGHRSRAPPAIRA